MRDVAIKHSSSRLGTYTRVLCDDGHFYATRDGWVAALEYVIARLGIATDVHISCNALSDLHTNAARVARVFPNVYVGRPYDIASRALYDELRTYPDLVERDDADDLIVIGADAAVPRNGAATACWVRLAPLAKPVVYTAHVKHNVNTAESHALHSALMARLESKRNSLTVLHSDSRTAVARVLAVVETGRDSELARPLYQSRYARARELIAAGRLHVRWVKGHNGDLANTLADQAARGLAHVTPTTDDGAEYNQAAYDCVARLLDTLSDSNPERLLADYRRAVLTSLTTPPEGP